MKKLFIGCGIVVLVALALLGYFGYQLWPDIKAFVESNERFVERLDVLDDQHPFEPDATSTLDTVRFASALELRVDFRDEFSRRVGELKELGQQEEEPSFLEGLSAGFQALRDISETVPAFLERETMGPTEFEYHVRLLWATLESVGAGLGGEELAPLRGEHAELRAAMPALQRDFKDLRPLEEIVGEFDPALIASARDILATDPQRVLDGIAEPFVEVIVYMGLSSLRVEELVASTGAARHQAEPSDPAEPPPR